MPLPLTQHVTNYELSKRLKEAGCPQFGTVFAWAEVAQKEKDSLGRPLWKYEVVKNDFQADIEFIAAYLASEVGAILPLYLKEDADRVIAFSVETYGLQIYKNYNDSGWVVCYGHRRQSALTLPDAMGEMVVYLKENGLIEF